MFIHVDILKLKFLKSRYSIVCEKGNETPGFIFINPGSIE